LPLELKVFGHLVSSSNSGEYKNLYRKITIIAIVFVHLEEALRGKKLLITSCAPLDSSQLNDEKKEILKYLRTRLTMGEFPESHRDYEDTKIESCFRATSIKSLIFYH
jgi:hypothetical protein